MAARAASQRRGYATVAEVAAYTGFKIKTLYNYRYRGGGPPFTGKGRGVRYPWDGVDAWMRNLGKHP